MGYNLHVLGEDHVDSIYGYNMEKGRSLCLEIRENFHAHVGDDRPVYTKEEFLLMSDHWAAARKKYDAMGQPEPLEQNDSLSQSYLPGKGLHAGRVAIEMTGDPNTQERQQVHFHYNNHRIDFSEKDLHTVGRVFGESLKGFAQHYHINVSLKDPGISIPHVAKNLYRTWLEEYEGGEDPDNFWDLHLKHKELIRPADEQRYSNGWHPDGDRKIPYDFHRKYLYTVYECLKKYGYGKGPFQYDYMPAWRVDGIIHISAAHRCAALLKLGYDEVPIVLLRNQE